MTRDFFVREYVKLSYKNAGAWIGLGTSIFSIIVFFISLIVLNRFNGYALFIGVLFLFLHPLIHYFNAKRYYDISPALQEETIYTIDETGVERRSISATMVIKWNDFMRIGEAKDVFFICENIPQAYFIPKKDMTAQQITDLQALLKTVKL